MSKPIKTPSETPITGVNTDPTVVNTAESQTETPSASAPLQPSKVTKVTKLKQEAVAEVLQGGKAGQTDTSGGVIAAKAASYSGNDASISGSLATTPTVKGDTRGGSRFGKKIDETVKNINDLASEQVVVEVTKPTPISKGGVQGGNKSNRNDATVRTKTKGATPNSHLFQRSIDEIRRDELVYGTGQIVKDPSAHYEDVPTKTEVFNAADGTYSEDVFGVQKRGNYIPRALKFSLNAQGIVTDMSYDVDDVTPVENEALFINAAAPHAKIHANKTELQRRLIDDVAGDEAKDGWNPLARAVKEPTRTVSYLKDLEQDTGNHAYMASRFAQLALAYQINRTGKDGNLSNQPIEEAFMSLIYGELDFDSYSRTIQQVLGSQNDMKRGSPALLIKAFDSLSKYKTKGDVLNMPNGLKSHLFKGQNFIKNLKANKQLIKYLEKTQAFSTIDGNYDGVHPTYINDTYLVTSPFDWNEQFSFTGRTKYDPDCLVGNAQAPFAYGYEDVRSRYITVAHHALLKGIYDWLSRHGSSLVSAAGEGDFTIPIAYSTTKLSTWTFLVMAALADVEKNRLTAMREIQYFENAHGKVLFDDLQPLDGYVTTSAQQFSFVSIGEPLKIGSLNMEAKLAFLMPETFWNFDEESRGVIPTAVDYRHALTPWYFTENSFMNEGIANVLVDPEAFAMSWPKIRSGIVLDQLSDIVDMGERQVRLALDRMIYPIVKTIPYSDFRVYKYDKSADGIPAITYRQSALTYLAYLTTPRELGIRVALPAGYATPLLDGSLRKLSDAFNFETSFRAKMYVGNLSDGTNKDAVIEDKSINIDRGSVYFQEWYYNRAEITGGNPKDGGFLMSTKELFSVAADAASANFVEGKSVFIPFTNFGTGYNQAAVSSTENKLISLHKAFWTRAQLLPFIISPWDTTAYARGIGEDGQKHDIFDFAYMFGLVGFESSFFEEDHYNRMDKQIQEGYVFIEDIYLLDTTLLK